MKYLFLDFDGVTSPCNEFGISRPEDLFSCTPYLWTILCQHPDVRVVFSTSWRTRHSLDDLIRFVTRGSGEVFTERFVGVTPVLSDDAYPHRRRECEAWLAEHGSEHLPWLMIDDTPALVGFGESPTVHITDYRRGLTMADVLAISEKIQAMFSSS